MKLNHRVNLKILKVFKILKYEMINGICLKIPKISRIENEKWPKTRLMKLRIYLPSIFHKSSLRLADFLNES